MDILRGECTDMNYKIMTEYSGKMRNAGSKARNDAYTILEEHHFTEIKNYARNNDGDNKTLVYYVKRAINCWKTYRELKNHMGEYIIVQYPDYSSKFIQTFIRQFWNRNNIIFLIHDIDTWRNFSVHSDEFSILNKAKSLIVHNKYMQKHLRECGVTKPYIVNLELFDYLTDAVPQAKKIQKSVVFAGNLGKSQFLPEWIKLSLKYTIDLYGIGLKNIDTLPGTVQYHGSFTPEELPVQIQGGLGLVWDGDSIDTCAGGVGEYTRYNNPHKLSLYIATGIPVIVWKEAAIADLVRKYDIGYTISSLREIDNIMDKLTPERYTELIDHIKPLQEKVLHGDFLRSAMDKVITHIESTTKE